MVNVFDVAAAGDSERGLVKQAAQDKLAAAIYDVRDKHGAWLFAATDLDAFNDRAKLAYVSICQTIEPHLHARKGVHRQVLKAMEREWRQKQAAHVPKNRETETAAHDTEAQTPEFWDAVRHHQEQGYHPDAAYSRAFAQHGIAIPELPDATALRNQYGLHEDPEVARWQNYESSRRQAAVTEDTISNRIDTSVANSRTGPKDIKTPRMPSQHVHGPVLEGNRHQACYPGCHENEAHAKKFHKGEDSDEKEARRRQAGPPVHQDPDRAHRVLDQTHQKVDEQAQKYHQVVDHAHELVDQRSQPDPYDEHAVPYPGSFLPPEAQGEMFNQHFQGTRYADFDESQNHPELNTNVTFQDHQGENLIPKGDWDGYRNRVDQGGPGKIERDFIDGEHVQRHNEDGGHNFVSSLSEYNRIARMLYADAGAAPPVDPNIGSIDSGTAPNMSPTATAPTAPVTGTSMTPGAGTAPPVTTPMTASREYQIIAAMLRQGVDAIGTPGGAANLGPVGGPSAGTPLPPGTADAMVGQSDLGAGSGVASGGPIPAGQPGMTASRRYADRNYLQQADEAITKVLNEKAEEFQQTIAPLQQALITIQQAEALANPLNVTAPAGTVNVLPQGAQGNAPAGQAPQGAGGLGADPAAAGLAAQPPQQVQARRGGPPKKADGAARPHRRADVKSEYSRWLTKKPGLPTGGPADYQEFAEQKQLGPRAVEKLKYQPGVTPGGVLAHPKQVKQPLAMPKNMVGQRRQALIAEPDFHWAHSPSTTHVEFANRKQSGVHPDEAYRQMVAEIADRHSQGEISNRDAHRAANEAFGRMLMSRKKLAMYESDECPKCGWAGHHDPDCEDRDVDLNLRKVVHDDERDPWKKKGQRKQSWTGWGPDLKPKHHKVAGWEWDGFLDAYVANKPRKFQCSCGDPVPVPDYHRCKCGTTWNSYPIGVGGDKHQATAEKFLMREIAERKGVIVASKDTDGAIPFEDEIENANPFPSDHIPKVDTSVKGKSAPDWYRRDHSTQRWLG